MLLLNPVEVQAEFLAVANQLSTPGPSPHSTYTTLLLHAFQATFGPHCDLPGLHCRLQVCAWGPGLSSAPSRQRVSLQRQGPPWAQQRPLPTEVLTAPFWSPPGYTGPPHPE